MTSRVLFRAERLSAEAAGVRPVLGFDTGAPQASLALFVSGRIVTLPSRPATSHGSALPAAVAELLDKAKLSLTDVGGIAVGLGPGSFTGLRVGLSYAKGIAMATRCAIFGVSTLDSIALGAVECADAAGRPGTLVCPVMDARKGEVYTALYGIVADGLEKLSDDLVMPLARLGSHLTASVLVVGDSKADEAASLLKAKGLEVAILDRETLDTRGRLIAMIGAARLARGDTDRAESLEPLYVRPPETGTGFPARLSAAASQEGLWSAERKNSFGSI